MSYVQVKNTRVHQDNMRYVQVKNTRVHGNMSYVQVKNTWVKPEQHELRPGQKHASTPGQHALRPSQKHDMSYVSAKTREHTRTTWATSKPYEYHWTKYRSKLFGTCLDGT